MRILSNHEIVKLIADRKFETVTPHNISSLHYASGLEVSVGERIWLLSDGEPVCDLNLGYIVIANDGNVELGKNDGSGDYHVYSFSRNKVL